MQLLVAGLLIISAGGIAIISVGGPADAEPTVDACLPANGSLGSVPADYPPHLTAEGFTEENQTNNGSQEMTPRQAFVLQAVSSLRTTPHTVNATQHVRGDRQSIPRETRGFIRSYDPTRNRSYGTSYRSGQRLQGDTSAVIRYASNNTGWYRYRGEIETLLNQNESGVAAAYDADSRSTYARRQTAASGMQSPRSQVAGYLPVRGVNVTTVGSATVNGEEVALVDVTGGRFAQIGGGIVQDARGCMAVGVETGIIHHAQFNLSIRSQEGPYTLETRFRVGDIGSAEVPVPPWLSRAQSTIDRQTNPYRSYQATFIGSERAAVLLYRPSDAPNLPAGSEIQVTGDSFNGSVTHTPVAGGTRYISLSRTNSDALVQLYPDGNFRPQEIDNILNQTSLNRSQLYLTEDSRQLPAPLTVEIRHEGEVLYTVTLTAENHLLEGRSNTTGGEG